MLAVETIYIHRTCKSQVVRMGSRPFFCEVCNRQLRPEEVMEVDNTPSPFAG